MANRTVKDAQTIKGTNPQYLIEKITRTRIYESKYWKEQCFALSAELLVDKAMELRYIGGVFGGNVKPTPFLCLLLKMLQIQPDKDIVVYFITQQDYKYTRALGAVYLRLTGNSMDCYKYLEPLLLDYRKIRMMDREGSFQMKHMDEFIDDLLHEERACDIILPRIQKRNVLEETNQLEQRVSALDDDMDEMETSDEEEDPDKKEPERMSASPERRPPPRDWDRPRRSPSPRYRRPPSPHRGVREHHRDFEGHGYGERQGERHRDFDRGGRDRDHVRERRRSRSKERHRHHDSHRDRDRDRDRRKRDKHGEEDRHHHHKSKKSKRDRESAKDEEIRLANEQRAKLGLAPLRP